MKYLRIGDLMLSSGAITEAQLGHALELQKSSKKRLGDILIENGFITEDQLIKALQQQLGIEYIDLNAVTIPQEMASVVSGNLAKKHKLLPVRVAGGELYLAMVDPLNFVAAEEVKVATKKKVIPMIAHRSAMDHAIAGLYGSEGVARAIEEMSRDQVYEAGDIESAINTVLVTDADPSAAPTIRLVNSILERAVTENASDIHLEPRSSGMYVRMRIDGLLHDITVIPRKLQNAVISRLKVIGGLDIAERRLPQDGRANIQVGKMEVDVRISTMPTIHGEKTVLRLLLRYGSTMTPEGLGLYGRNLEKFRELLHGNIHGAILIVGPTGSGKSSTMYAMINELNSEEVNLISLEDPVEYQIDGVNQVQINDKIGLDFASGLRSLLRQDPDIIAVGEIRDGETAEIAMRSAMTGHLVLSTVHTSNAISVLDRLFDLGVDSFLIAGGVKGIVSQRLVRRICTHCREAYEPDEAELRSIGMSRQQLGSRSFFRGAGCTHCFHSGYRGRIAAFEILSITPEIRRMIYDRAQRAALEDAVQSSGFDSILANCRELILEGVTTVEEVLRTVQNDD